MARAAYVAWFSEVDKDDIALVGGKGANLGEMVRAHFPVPNGFIITVKAFFHFIKENKLEIKITHLLKIVDYTNPNSLVAVSNYIKKYFLKAAVSEELIREIFLAYRRLGGVFKDALVAVRSSATAEDLPLASFAGQQETFLNVQGEANLLLAIKEAWASLYTPRAMFYRHEHRFDQKRVGIAVAVQKMVSSDASGVMFTIDPLTNDKSTIVIEAIFGLGELIVQGAVTPDHYEVAKQSLLIAKKNIEVQPVLLKKVATKNKEVRVSKRIGKRQKISDNKIVELASLGKKLERHYFFPQDVEWAIEKNKVYIVQTRPVTTIGSRKSVVGSQIGTAISELRHPILKGDPASPGIATGPVRIVKSLKELSKIVRGDVLVAEQTNPDFVPAMKKTVAIVTEKGGRTSHAAIVARELGIPAVVGAKDALKILKERTVITVNGQTGEVLRGGHLLPLRAPSTLPSPLIKTATKVYVNLAEPQHAQQVAAQYVDGVGLLRAEFMIAQIGIHPKKLIKDKKTHHFVATLAEGLTSFCSAFSPRPVVYRTSDLKTNEYRGLVGGRDFEPKEENPMLGFRGAFRYVSNPDVFELELAAVKHVRETHNNLWVMVPFVRSVKELIAVKKLISEGGLYRSETFKLWMMVEVPANVILLEKFIYTGIDGVSIGSNDLTMLLLGTDRDNSEVASAFNEQNEAVLWALERVVKTAHKYNVTSSICGQAATLFPSLVAKLVGFGITSVSVSPDAIDETRRVVAEAEKKLAL